MSKFRLLRTRRDYIIFFLIWFSFAASGIAFYVYTENQYVRVTEVGICPSESAAPLVMPAVVQEQTPYVCGTLAGNVRGRNISIQLYKADKLVAQTPRYIYLGRFSEPVARQPTLEHGDYRVRIVQGGQQLMAETSFTVQP